MPAQRRATIASKKAPEAVSEPSQKVEPQAAPVPAPPEPQYNITLEFESAPWSGDLQYHTRWPASKIKRLLAGQMDFVQVKKANPLPGAPAEARYVALWAIQEVHISGWPEEEE